MCIWQIVENVLIIVCIIVSPVVIWLSIDILRGKF